MRDNDTKILEERYQRIVEDRYDLSADETHGSHQAKTGSLALYITLHSGDEAIEDVPVEVEYDIYRGSTPYGGDDPNNINVFDAIISDDVSDDSGTVVIPAGTSLNDAEGMGWSYDEQELRDSVYGREFN